MQLKRTNFLQLIRKCTISPKYLMQLITSIEKAIWDEYGGYEQVRFYIDKWHKEDYNHWENFSIFEKQEGKIDLKKTLHNMNSSLVLKIAIDMEVDTPDFIPSIPTFKNELKSDYKTAYNTFTKAYKQIESDPDLAVGLANSALESIVKEILKDERLISKVNGTETLYKLTSLILKEFKLSNHEHPKEIKTIGSSLLAINQAIEKLRSERTNFHGKTNEDYLITDTSYTYFIVNSVATVGLFLNSYYKTKFPPPVVEDDTDELPF